MDRTTVELYNTQYAKIPMEDIDATASLGPPVLAHVQVRPINWHVNFIYSECTVPPNPLSPRNFRVSSLSSTSATVNWQAPVMQTNNGISGYKLVLREQKFGQRDVTKNVAANRLSYAFSGLEEFNTYEVQIKSVSVFTFESSLVSISLTTMEAGVCIQSYCINEYLALCQYYTHYFRWSHVSILLYTYTAPASPPGSLSGSSHGSNALSLSWRSVSPIDINGRLNCYEIDIMEVETGRQFQTTSSSTGKTIVSLHPYYVYKCRVAAVTIARGPYTQYINIRTDESGELLRNYILNSAKLLGV